MEKYNEIINSKETIHFKSYDEIKSDGWRENKILNNLYTQDKKYFTDYYNGAYDIKRFFMKNVTDSLRISNVVDFLFSKEKAPEIHCEKSSYTGHHEYKLKSILKLDNSKDLKIEAYELLEVKKLNIERKSNFEPDINYYIGKKIFEIIF